MFSPLNTLGGIFNSIVQCLADVDNLLALLSVVPEVTDCAEAIPLSPTSIQPLHENRKIGLSIEFEGLRCFLKSDVFQMLHSAIRTKLLNSVFKIFALLPLQGLRQVFVLLSGINLAAIVGPTGSGKTSLSRLLFRFYDPQGGVIRIGDHDIKRFTQYSLRRCIGIVPQDTTLFNDTLLYNIRYSQQDATIAQVEEVVRLAHIKAFVDGLPDGLNTQVGERGIRLSGGEKQRVAIARCLVFLIFAFFPLSHPATRSSDSNPR